MPYTRRSGVRIHYRVIGKGSPLLLVHGYTSSGWSNWVSSGWVEFLSAHHTLLVPDLRGHGRSQKPYTTVAYSIQAIAQDVLAVMDREGFQARALFGYSMGGMVALELLLAHPDRIEAAIIGGMGATSPAAVAVSRSSIQATSSTAPRRKPAELLRFVGGYLSQFDPIALDGSSAASSGATSPSSAARLQDIQSPSSLPQERKTPFLLLPATLPPASRARVSCPSRRGPPECIRNPVLRASVEAFLERLDREAGGAQLDCGYSVAMGSG